MVADIEVYRELQKHLDKMPVGYPATKSGVEINLLEAIFTPEEAKITTHLEYKPKTVAQIYETAQDDIETEEELIRELDAIVAKGGISRRRQDDQLQYAVIPFVLWGVYEQQLKRLDPAFLNDVGEYLMGELGYELATNKLPKMRVIPIEESINIEHRVATYDELRHVIEKAGDHIAIQDCICKKVSDLQGEARQFAVDGLCSGLKHMENPPKIVYLGTDLEGKEAALEAGADVFVAGSAVYGAADPAAMVERLRSLAAAAGS